jgi:hypothetical protein
VSTSLIKKLRIQPGQRALILNAPAGYSKLLGDLPEGVELLEVAEGRFGFVHLFVKDSAELDRLRPVALEAVEYDGLLWISYPKKSARVSTDLSRDGLWELMAGTGLGPVTQIAVDDIRSALRFRPAEAVGK